MRKTTSYFIDWGDWELEFEVVDGGYIQLVGNQDLMGNQITKNQFINFITGLINIQGDLLSKGALYENQGA